MGVSLFDQLSLLALRSEGWWVTQTDLPVGTAGIGDAQVALHKVSLANVAATHARDGSLGIPVSLTRLPVQQLCSTCMARLFLHAGIGPYPYFCSLGLYLQSRGDLLSADPLK